jgi:tRNA uridine 5-carboxymethylaminomethyl modification enzyme
VRATRAQADRVLYRAAIRRRLENQPNLWLFQQAVDDLMLDGRPGGGRRHADRPALPGAGRGADGRHLPRRAHPRRLQNYSAGRAGDPPALSLSARLKELKLPQGRLKTGTPPRIDGRSDRLRRLQEQPGDLDPVPVFSFLGQAAQHPRQVPCWITHTNERTHEIIRAGFDRSPMFTGVIEGVGPRYCPSIEDKVNRFADKTSHQIFLEPEGLTTHEFYPTASPPRCPSTCSSRRCSRWRGWSGAHPAPRLRDRVRLFRPARAEHALRDAGDPRAVLRRPDQRHHRLRGGRGAGAVRRHQRGAAGAGREPWLPRRDEAYLGVLVDDLITKGVTEPYRMFTSRAEYRLQLREDNADLRLTEAGRRLGLVDDRRWDAFNRKRDAIERELQRLRATWVRPQTVPAAEAERLLGKALEHEHHLADLLRRPGVGFDVVAELAAIAGHDRAVSRETLRAELGPREADLVIEQVEIGLRYAGYIDRQKDEVERAAQYENLRLPADFDYEQVSALSVEVRHKLGRQRPATLGQAARISGVTPAAISCCWCTSRRAAREALRQRTWHTRSTTRLRDRARPPRACHDLMTSPRCGQEPPHSAATSMPGKQGGCSPSGTCSRIATGSTTSRPFAIRS